MPQRFAVRRDDLAQTTLQPLDAGSPLAPGQVRLRIDRFAFTANNITYAVFGEKMQYWRFFPTSDEHWGCIPVWGHAEVEASACDGVTVGERCYGYWPMATHAVLAPVAIAASHFTDGSAHRAGLPAAYNRYLRVPRDTDAQHEAQTALLRPLFTTAWLIADFMAQAQDFGATTMLLSSASSKTALATAFCLRRRTGSRARIVGATSASRLAFVSALNVFDQVIAYDALTTLPPSEPTLYIDFAGDTALRRRVHEHWQERLRYSCAVGVTHHDAMATAGALPGPRPQFFFAPAQIEKRGAAPPQGLGRAALMAAIEEAWTAFIARVASAEPPWLAIEERRGAAAMQAAYLETLHGRGDPARGLMLSF